MSEAYDPDAEVTDAPDTSDGAVAVPHTGEPRVDDAMARLADLEGTPVEDQLEIYQDVHRRLHEALADLDSR